MKLKCNNITWSRKEIEYFITINIKTAFHFFFALDLVDIDLLYNVSLLINLNTIQKKFGEINYNLFNKKFSG
jgi:hypothetical protein